jgi:hypothetical protein
LVISNGPAIRRRDAITAGAAALLFPAPAAAEGVTVTPGLLHGRRALTLSNGRFSLSLLPGGGYIGDVHLVSADPRANISPMRVPDYQTIDPYTFDPARDAAKYSNAYNRRVMAGYMGHFTCFPQFGYSKAEFEASGYGSHGELIIRKWERESAPAGELAMRVHLPLNQYDFRRRITMLPGETVAYVEETAESLVAYERPFQWVQHVTMGPPFVALNRMWADGSAEAVWTGPKPGAITPWPHYQGADGKPADARIFSGHTVPWRMQRQKPRNWLAAYSADYRLLLAHIYEAAPNPWVLDWQSNLARATFAPLGRMVARGLCWGNSPLSVGIKDNVRLGEVEGVPTYGWMGAKGRRSQRYLIVMAEIPRGWRGTADIAAGNGLIRIVERGNGRILTLKAAQA